MSIARRANSPTPTRTIAKITIPSQIRSIRSSADFTGAGLAGAVSPLGVTGDGRATSGPTPLAGPEKGLELALPSALAPTLRCVSAAESSLEGTVACPV